MVFEAVQTRIVEVKDTLAQMGTISVAHGGAAQGVHTDLGPVGSVEVMEHGLAAVVGVEHHTATEVEVGYMPAGHNLEAVDTAGTAGSAQLSEGIDGQRVAQTMMMKTTTAEEQFAKVSDAG